MRTAVLVLAAVLAASAAFAQTGPFGDLKAAYAKRCKGNVEAYGKALSSVLAALKAAGDLDGYLAAESERRRFEAAGTVAPTNSGPAVAKALAEYEAASLATLKAYVPALEELTRRLVREGRVEEAKAVRDERDRASFEMAELEVKAPKVEAVANALALKGTNGVASDFRARKLTLVTPNKTFKKMAIPKDGVVLSPSPDVNSDIGNGKFYPLETEEDIKPPFVAKATAMTDSTNIRFHWNKRQVFIFNWEMSQTELRFHDPASGRVQGVAGKGFVAPNKWHDFVWEVSPDGMKISVDGEQVFEEKGDYKGVTGKVGMFTWGNTKVMVKSLSVSSGK